MPLFHNKSTGAVITVNGVVAQDYSQRTDWEEVNPATNEPVGDLSDLTVPELKSYAEESGVDLSGADKKADIVAAIKKETEK